MGQDIGKRLQQVRMLLDRNRRRFCHTYKVSYDTLTSWEFGRVSLSYKGATRLCKIFQDAGINCSVEWLLYGVGNTPEKCNRATDPHIVTSPSDLRQEEIKFFISLYQKHHAVVVTVTDDSALPLYAKGDTVGGFAENIVQDMVGETCIVRKMDGTFVVRHVSQIGEMYQLLPLNPKMPSEIVQGTCLAAKIAWIRRLS